MKEWKKELCAVQPKALERVNPDTFIQRRNIEPYEREVMDGQTEKGFFCEYRFLSVDEYCTLQEQEEGRAAIRDDILTSMGAQADIYEAIQTQEENQLTIMEAIAELYEMKEGGV